MAVRVKVALASLVMLAATPGLAQPIGLTAPAARQPEQDEGLQFAASVGQVNRLTRQGDLNAALFSTIGHPALNGVYLYLSFEISPQEGARIFMVGDVGDYRIVSEAPGRLLLVVTEDHLEDGPQPVQRRRRVLVSWTPGPGGTPPMSVTVATAR